VPRPCVISASPSSRSRISAFRAVFGGNVVDFVEVVGGRQPLPRRVFPGADSPPQIIRDLHIERYR